MITKNQIPSSDYITAQINFIFRARMLWRDLATWLRSYKVSLYGGAGNTEALSRRSQINNDTETVNNYTQQLYQNTDSTAAFLASINPYWTKGEWVTLLEAFNNLQLQEATTFLTKDYTRNIDIFDRIISLTSIIGDYFSEGLTNYFILKQQQQAS
jgi:hypothetical protein